MTQHTFLFIAISVGYHIAANVCRCVCLGKVLILHLLYALYSNPLLSVQLEHATYTTLPYYKATNTIREFRLAALVHIHRTLSTLCTFSENVYKHLNAMVMYRRCYKFELDRNAHIKGMKRYFPNAKLKFALQKQL